MKIHFQMHFHNKTVSILGFHHVKGIHIYYVKGLLSVHVYIKDIILEKVAILGMKHIVNYIGQMMAAQLVNTITPIV